MNNIVLSGNLGDNPKIMQAGEHTKATFSVAVRDGIDKEKNPKVLWFFCEAWDKQAEFAEKYLKKGQRIEISGKAVPGSYEQNGVRHNTLSIRCRTIDFGGPKPHDERDSDPAEETSSSVNDGFMNIPEGIEDENVFQDTVFCPNCFTEVIPDGDACPQCGSTLPALR